MTDDTHKDEPQAAEPQAAERPRRWRALAIAGGVVALILLLVGVPAFLATRPAYFNRFAKMQPRVETWHSSVHAKASCQECHADPGFLAQATYTAKMVGVFYKSLVVPSAVPAVMQMPTNEACSHCHMELRSVSPAGDLNIPHRAHVDVLGVRCIRCHKFLVHEKSPEGSNHPRMVACLECHDGKQAKNACVTCHTEKAAPAGHQAADWLVVHPKMQGKLDCAKCHGWTENWCAECHSRRPRTHTVKWRSEHGAAVAKRRNCEACHTADFCIKCHGQLPKLNYDPSLKLAQ